LLLVLRLSPIAHASWLTRAAPGRHLHELTVAVFNTQRRAVRKESGAEDQVPVISVFLAPNQPLGEDVIVKESDRHQVLDAVIEYGDALVMVIENKVAEASDAQARELNITGAGVVIAPGQERQVVTWPEVIGDITGIGGAWAGVLGVVRSTRASMEGSPGTYRAMDEENLRQVMLLGLNKGPYQGQAGAEVFNFEGKTDILIRDRGRPIFIAECKIWSGAKEFSDAIDQLFRYTAWGDTKLSLIVFVKQRDLTTVMERAREALAAPAASACGALVPLSAPGGREKRRKYPAKDYDYRGN
jgi:hypothetical protein